MLGPVAGSADTIVPLPSAPAESLTAASANATGRYRCGASRRSRGWAAAGFAAMIGPDPYRGHRQMRIDLSGKRAVITGGSRGIGRAIALACAEAGAAVSICARGADGLGPVRDEIAAHGVAAHAQACDIADGAALAGYIEAAAAALGGIDILVCNASGFGTTDDEAGWQRAKNNNPQLYGAILRGIPFGRLGAPEEVARVVVFLASPLAGWVTGQTISVDGGQLL